MICDQIHVLKCFELRYRTFWIERLSTGIHQSGATCLLLTDMPPTAFYLPGTYKWGLPSVWDPVPKSGPRVSLPSLAGQLRSAVTQSVQLHLIWSELFLPPASSPSSHMQRFVSLHTRSPKKVTWEHPTFQILPSIPLSTLLWHMQGITKSCWGYLLFSNLSSLHFVSHWPLGLHHSCLIFLQ